MVYIEPRRSKYKIMITKNDYIKNLVSDAFRVPIFDVQTTVNTQSLIDYAYELKNESKGRVISNVSGWQSSDLDIKLPVFDELKNTINKFAQDLHEYIDLKKDRLNILDNLWFNINSKGSSNRPHTHPGSVFSGVFYLKVPKNSGRIVFTNPNKLNEYHFDKDRVNSFNDYTSSYRWYEPKQSKLIMFPANLEHYVEGHTADEDRISIAFNTKLDNE